MNGGFLLQAGTILVLVAAALVARRFLRREIEHLVWVLVLLKLIVPPLFEVPVLPAREAPPVLQEPHEPIDLATLEAAPELPAIDRARSAISRAALLVKVTARRCFASMPDSRRRAMRTVTTRVFPVPAPASTRSGPSPCSTASR